MARENGKNVQISIYYNYCINNDDIIYLNILQKKR